jgi:hypothetical protein
MSTQKPWSISLTFFGSNASNRVAVFVVQCSIVLVEKHLAFVSPWVLDRWGLRLGAVVRTEGDLRLDGLCEGGGHSGSWLLRIEEACSGGLNSMSISGLLFAAFVPVFATFVSDTRYRYPLRPALRSRKATLGMLPLSVKENAYWLFNLFSLGITDLPLSMPNTECASMRSVSRGGRY